MEPSARLTAFPLLFRCSRNPRPMKTEEIFSDYCWLYSAVRGTFARKSRASRVKVSPVLWTGADGNERGKGKRNVCWGFSCFCLCEIKHCINIVLQWKLLQNSESFLSSKFFVRKVMKQKKFWTFYRKAFERKLSWAFTVRPENINHVKWAEFGSTWSESIDYQNKQKSESNNKL